MHKEFISKIDNEKFILRKYLIKCKKRNFQMFNVQVFI